MRAVDHTVPFPENFAGLDNAVAAVLHDSELVGTVWFKFNWERQRVGGHLWWTRFTEQAVALHYGAVYSDRGHDDSNSIAFPLSDELAQTILVGGWSEREWIVLGADGPQPDTSGRISLALEFLSGEEAQRERRRIAAALGWSAPAD